MKGYIYILFATVLLASCSSAPKDVVLAQMGEKKLMLQEVHAQMPDVISPGDSIAYVEHYVNQWVERELLYMQGMRYLENVPELLDQVEEYKRTLVSQTYERELLRQYEAEVTDEECEAFYEKYSKQMLLNEPVVLGFYVKLPSDNTKHDALKTWLKQLEKGNTDYVEELEQYLQLRATDYDGFLEQWHPMHFVTDRLPVQVVDAASFLKLKIYEMEDDDYKYYLLVTDFRLEGEVMPYEYALPEIREILLTQHRREYQKRAYAEIKEQALSSGNLKLYNTTE